MLGILFIYWIGNSFYKLAESFNKNKWLFAIMGVVTYYAGGFLLGIFLGIVMAISPDSGLTDVPSMAWDIVAIPFGLLTVYGLYRFLKWQWEKPAKTTNEEVLDADMMK